LVRVIRKKIGPIIGVLSGAELDEILHEELSREAMTLEGSHGHLVPSTPFDDLRGDGRWN
jgi:hypothetical protein